MMPQVGDSYTLCNCCSAHTIFGLVNELCLAIVIPSRHTPDCGVFVQQEAECREIGEEIWCHIKVIWIRERGCGKWAGHGNSSREEVAGDVTFNNDGIVEVHRVKHLAESKPVVA